MVPAGRIVGVGGNEVDRIGETFTRSSKNLEGLGLSGEKADCYRSWHLLKVEGQEHVRFKSVGWTMRSIVLAPAEASTYHHVPMSCPTPQINSQYHFLPQWLAAANASPQHAAA